MKYITGSEHWNGIELTEDQGIQSDLQLWALVKRE